MNRLPNCQEALASVSDFIDNSELRNLPTAAQAFDLQRVRQFLTLLENPQQKFETIHIAGTKGKGSVAALISRALVQGGYAVGLYTSPYLIDFCEQIQVDHTPIAAGELAAGVAEIRPLARQVPGLTRFELMTGLAFQYFARRGVDVAVVEAGLGGRLDATNCVEPLVSVITSISYDHMNVLGSSLEEIAGHKAGIIKPGRPVVLAPQRLGAEAVVAAEAERQAAPLYRVGREYRYEAVTHSLEGQSLRIWAQGGQPVELTIPLLGRHQVENAATAYAALDVARRHGLLLAGADLQAGFAAAAWPGRFQVVQREPPVILDGAHNADSAARLVEALGDYLPERRVILVFGASEDKDIPGILDALRPLTEGMIVARSGHPRAMDAARLAELAHAAGLEPQVSPSVAAALRTAVEMAGPHTAVVVTGSLFVVGEVLKSMQSS